MVYSDLKFSFITPRIIFGRGRINELGKEILTILEPRENQKLKAFLVSGRSSLNDSGYLGKIRKIIENFNIDLEIYNEVSKEPTTNIVNDGKDTLLEESCNFVIGCGGGSVMDTAKSIAGLATNGGVVEDYHAGKEFKKPPLPLILIPTTSGTGSEITNNAVIKDENTGIKKSIRGLWANLALLDPEITLSLPKRFTAYSGADALVQAVESFVSRSSNYISDFFAKESIIILGENLPKVIGDLSNIDLREKMMLGSLLDAISFANGKLGAVHGFAHPIGIKFDLPHGLICGLLLPYIMDYNLAIERVKNKYSWIGEVFFHQKILVDYGECPKKLPTEEFGKAKWAIEKIKDIFRYVDIPLHLKEVGIQEKDLDDIVE